MTNMMPIFLRRIGWEIHRGLCQWALGQCLAQGVDQAASPPPSHLCPARGAHPCPPRPTCGAYGAGRGGLAASLH